MVRRAALAEVLEGTQPVRPPASKRRARRLLGLGRSRADFTKFVWRPVSHSLPERLESQIHDYAAVDGGSVKNLPGGALDTKTAARPRRSCFERTWRNRCHNVDARSGTGYARAVSALGGRASRTAGESAGDPTPSSARETAVSGTARSSTRAWQSVSSWLVPRDRKLREDGQGAREGGGLSQGTRR